MFQSVYYVWAEITAVKGTRSKKGLNPWGTRHKKAMDLFFFILFYFYVSQQYKYYILLANKVKRKKKRKQW